MAFVITHARKSIQPRFLTMVKQFSTKIDETDIKKSVFISQSKDIYNNLALEDWMYRNMNFENHHVMLLWKNEPCVVIGKNQNPWAEVDVDMLEKKGIKLARRNSGGGSVYNDSGNLNITFFSSTTRNNRKHNLKLLAKTLEKEWNLFPELNENNDIIVDGNYKICGTASKIARPTTYHHCSLLVDCDKVLLRSSLEKNNELFIKSNATKSSQSQTVNLGELHSGISINKLVAAVGWEYLRTCPLSQEDKGWGYVQKQNGFQMVNPSEGWFPGIEKLKQDFESWEWNFGKTPKFEITKNIHMGQGIVVLGIEVQAGVVSNVSMTLPSGVSWNGITGKASLYSTAIGKRFDTSIFTLIENAITRENMRFAGAEDLKRVARM